MLIENFSKLIKAIYRKLLPSALRKGIGGIRSRVYSRKNVQKHITGGNNHIIISKDAILDGVTFDIIGNGNTIQIGQGVYIHHLVFKARGNGNNIVLGDGVRFNLEGAIEQYGHNTSCEIGSNSSIERAGLFNIENDSKIIIGQDCMFSTGIDIRTSDSHPIFDRTSEERINFARDVVIKDRVWIGDSCKILKGVIIRNDSVIGCGSVVTKQFEESNVIIAGNPARIVKRNIIFSKDSCPPAGIITGDFIKNNPS